MSHQLRITSVMSNVAFQNATFTAVIETAVAGLSGGSCRTIESSGHKSWVTAAKIGLSIADAKKISIDNRAAIESRITLGT